MISIRDVAEEAGVSIGTVSNVVNNTGKVSAQMRQKVEEVINRLNYRPNPTAQSFRRSQTGILGILLPHEYPNSISPTLLGAIREAAHYNQSILISPPYETPEEEISAISYLASKQIDALLYEPRNSGLDLAGLKCIKGIPLVGMMRRNFGMDIPIVYTDNIKSGYLATRYLISLSRSNLAFVAGYGSYCNINTVDQLEQSAHSLNAGLYISNDRFLGYQMALEEAKIPYDPDYVYFSNLRESGGERVAQEILTTGGIDGIVADNNYSAMGMIHLFQSQGTQVPEDISIVGCDNDDIAIALSPSLTIVSHSFESLGKDAVILANKLLNGEDNIKNIVLDASLIIRQSTSRKKTPIESLTN